MYIAAMRFKSSVNLSCVRVVVSMCTCKFVCVCVCVCVCACGGGGGGNGGKRFALPPSVEPGGVSDMQLGRSRLLSVQCSSQSQSDQSDSSLTAEPAE